MGRGGVLGVMEGRREKRGVVEVGEEEEKVKVANLVSCRISPSDSWWEERKGE